MELREKVSNLRGVLVVAYEEGLQLGKVFDIYIEKQTKQIKGISFKTGLLRIEKEDFLQLVSNPMVKWIEPEQVKEKLSNGHQLLDVRYEEEWEDSSIPGATLIPLQSLRARFTELDINKPYITYCKGGARSAVAALLLTQRGYDAISMKGGIRDWPYEVQSNY